MKGCRRNRSPTEVPRLIEGVRFNSITGLLSIGLFFRMGTRHTAVETWRSAGRGYRGSGALTPSGECSGAATNRLVLRSVLSEGVDGAVTRQCAEDSAKEHDRLMEVATSPDASASLGSLLPRCSSQSFMSLRPFWRSIRLGGAVHPFMVDKVVGVASDESPPVVRSREKKQRRLFPAQFEPRPAAELGFG